MKSPARSGAWWVCVGLLALPAAAKPPVGWTPEALRMAIQGCRAAITDQAASDYLVRHKLQALPPGFHERIAPTIEPYLKICDCSMSTLSKEFSVEDFGASTPEVQQRMQQLAGPSGNCSPAKLLERVGASSP